MQHLLTSVFLIRLYYHLILKTHLYFIPQTSTLVREQDNIACFSTNFKIQLCFYCYNYRNSRASLGREKKNRAPFKIIASSNRLFFVEIISRNEPECCSPKALLYSAFSTRSARGHCDPTRVPAGIPLRTRREGRREARPEQCFSPRAAPQCLGGRMCAGHHQTARIQP